jgi:hypothetical protein
MQAAISSATTFLEKWFCKLRFFSVGWWVYTVNPPISRLAKRGSDNSDFFLVREKWLTRKKVRVCRTTLIEPEIKWLRDLPDLLT